MRGPVAICTCSRPLRCVSHTPAPLTAANTQATGRGSRNPPKHTPPQTPNPHPLRHHHPHPHPHHLSSPAPHYLLVNTQSRPDWPRRDNFIPLHKSFCLCVCLPIDAREDRPVPPAADQPPKLFQEEGGVKSELGGGGVGRLHSYLPIKHILMNFFRGKR